MTDFILPDIGEGVVECELVEWLVAVGDKVAEDQPICDVMTDKALVQIPAPLAGVISKLYYAKGELAKVHQPLYAINVEGQTVISPQAAVNTEAGFEKQAEIAGNNAACSRTVNTNQNAASQSAHVNSESSITLEDFLLPDIGEGIVECELVEWLVSEGDWVKEDEPICDVMTDKALVQIPALSDGQIRHFYYRKGQLAKVHSPLYAIAVAKKVAPAQPKTQSEPHALAQAANFTQQAPSAPSVIAVQGSAVQGTAQQQIELKTAQHIALGKALASPAVRRLARSLDINLAAVTGSGKHGRVYKEDVEKYHQAPYSPSQTAPLAMVNEVTSGANAAPPSTTPETALSVYALTTNGHRTEAIKGVKAVMARLMAESVATIPHFTYCEELDLTELIALRQAMKQQYQAADYKLTMMPFFMKAMSLALTQFPLMNSRVNNDCTELTYLTDHNIGMAVDSKIGLLVPNVKQVQTKSIIDIARDITRLTDDARSGRVSPNDLKQGTITISNIGAIGGTVATPIINKPEVAIVALGRVQALPRFNAKGEVEARQIMQISWSGDHRVIDGGTVARFCNLWKSYLEQPQTMLMAMR